MKYEFSCRMPNHGLVLDDPEYTEHHRHVWLNCYLGANWHMQVKWDGDFWQCVYILDCQPDLALLAKLMWGQS